MTKYIQGKDGKFAGSIGDGKASVPTAAPSVPNPATKSSTSPAELNDRYAAINARYAAQEAERAAQRAAEQASRDAWRDVSATLRAAYPEARWMHLTSDFTVSSLSDGDGQLIATGDQVAAECPTVADQRSALAGGTGFQRGSFKEGDGYRIGIFIACPEDGCDHLYYPEGMQPSHKASPFCRSGQRPHCTCDTCF